MVDPKGSAINFIRKGIELNNVIDQSIQIRGSAIYTRNLTPNQRLYLFYQMMIDAFNQNCKFITDVLEWRGTSLEPLRCNMRTLFEIYTRLLYLQNITPHERLKRVIGDTFWVFRGRGLTAELPKVDREMCKRESLNLPTEHEIENNGELRDRFMREWTFESVSCKSVIKRFHDETRYPTVTKDALVNIYSDFSNQLHGNVYLNMSGIPIDPTYQFLFTLMFLEIKFLYTISDLMIMHQADVEIYVNNAKESGIFDNLITQWQLVRTQYR